MLQPPKAAEIRAVIAGLSPDEFVSQKLLDRVPFLFEDDYEEYRRWRVTLARHLGVDPSDVCLVGSSALGASLNPAKELKAFGKDSDIDVAVISPFFFELSWRILRKLKPSDIRGEKEALALRRHTESLIYWGCIATDQILRLLPFSSQWAKAAAEMAGVNPTQGRNINFRVYKDFMSLRGYHVSNVRKLKVT